jgi:hypothetical protein
MKTFLETMMGSDSALSATTFRPTEAEKLVLLNIADLAEQGRSVTQQDAINISDEDLQKAELDKEQLESAYKQLINVRLIQVEPNQTIVISPEGQPVVEELKKAKEQEPEAPTDQIPMGDVGGMDGPGQGGALPGGTGDMGPAMENFTLFRYINDMSKILK